MTVPKSIPEREETLSEQQSADDDELDLSELEQIVGGAGGIDEVGLQNTSDGNGSGWWNDPNR